MVARADEAALLCAPECEAHASSGLGGQSQRRFEHCGRAATIVVDAGSLRHAVEMRAHNDKRAFAMEGRAAQHVSSQPNAAHAADGEAHGFAASTSAFAPAAQLL